MVLRLEALALQKYIELIKKLVLIEEYEIQREVSKTTLQKICSNFGEVKGLAAIIVSTIYSHSKAVLHWETMRKVLENCLHRFEVLEQKYYPLEKGNTGAWKEGILNSKEKDQLKEVTFLTKNNQPVTGLSLYPNSNKYNKVVDMFTFLMLAEGNEPFNPAEKMLMSLSLSNIKETCAHVDSQTMEMLSNSNVSRTVSLKNDMIRAVEDLESITTEMKSIQVIRMTIEKYLDTGPYKTWEEVQVEFLQYLIQQPTLHLYANQLSESLMHFCFDKVLRIGSSKRQKMLIEACLHPAMTKLNANEIPTHILLEMLPKVKELNTLKVKTRITRNQIIEKDALVFACLLKHCSKLKCLSVTFQSSPSLREESGMPLDVVLACLPNTLISVSFYGLNGALNVKFLDKMAASEKFISLNRLTLSEASYNYPLHKGFRNLVALALIYTQFTGSQLFTNVGAQLKELSLSSVSDIQIRILAECCPSLETLLLKSCTFSSSFHTEPLPTFSSLKELLFIIPSQFFRQQSVGKNICIWCILQNSPEIEKLVAVISMDKSVACFKKLMETNQMSHLQEFELYKRDRMIFKGLIKTDLAVQMINKCPTLSFIGGIEHAVTQRNLSELYSNKTFVCLHEKTIQYVREPEFEVEIYWEISDDSDGDDIF